MDRTVIPLDLQQKNVFFINILMVRYKLCNIEKKQKTLSRPQRKAWYPGGTHHSQPQRSARGSKRSKLQAGMSKITRDCKHILGCCRGTCSLSSDCWTICQITGYTKYGNLNLYKFLNSNPVFRVAAKSCHYASTGLECSQQDKASQDKLPSMHNEAVVSKGNSLEYW